MKLDYGTVLEDLTFTQVVNAIYNNSIPVGLGFLHFNPEVDLPEEYIKVLRHILDRDGKIFLDYLKGRCCKAVVKNMSKGDKAIFHVSFTMDEWSDHTQEQIDGFFDEVTS